MKNVTWIVLMIMAISLAGCGNKTTVTKTAEGKEITTVTSAKGRILSRTGN